jgi:F-type H+-transporting ATPase subunit gamma
MPSLKDLRARISSVKSTQKITKAMQMVAAAKLRRAQEAAESARPYAQRMAAVIANLAASVGDAAGGPKLLSGTGKSDVHLIVVLTAERGLCGGFNANVVKLARIKIRDLIANGKTVQIATVGKKGRDALRREFAHLMVSHVDLRGDRHINAGSASKVWAEIETRFEDGTFDVATLIYSRFQNVLVQTPTAQQLIPATAPEGAATLDLKGATYEYEPSETSILEALLPQYVNTQILSALLESAAGEQGARMTAMDNATRNAGELIGKLTLKYNRMRQANITKELIEIISGAEAL